MRKSQAHRCNPTFLEGLLKSAVASSFWSYSHCVGLVASLPISTCALSHLYLVIHIWARSAFVQHVRMLGSCKTLESVENPEGDSKRSNASVNTGSLELQKEPPACTKGPFVLAGDLHSRSVLPFTEALLRNAIQSLETFFV